MVMRSASGTIRHIESITTLIETKILNKRNHVMDDNKKNQKNQELLTIEKVVSIGVGAAFMTEDAVKNILSDLPLPKHIVSGLRKMPKAPKKNLVMV